MGENLTFDEKNEKDYIEYTERINFALGIIAKEHKQPATKSNLARLSGVHRNTLRNRAIMDCPAELRGRQDAANFGWPYSVLAEIIAARKSAVLDKGETISEISILELKVKKLEQQLGMSRHQVAAWFNRAIQLKRERDEARRSVELLASNQRMLKEEVSDLRKKLVQSIKVLK